MGEIERIQIAMSMKPMGPVIQFHPRTSEEELSSLPYNVACCLVDLEIFTEESFRRPERFQGESRFVEFALFMRGGRVI